jgi:hypothetical protein
MTKDEILNMPAGREMDALIAEKVMGAKWIDGCLRYSEDEKWMVRILCGVTIHARTLPLFTEDIAAAWQAGMHIHEKYKCQFDVGTVPPHAQTDERKFFCRIAGGKLEYANYDLTLVMYAPTAPLAICRALLQVLDGE